MWEIFRLLILTAEGKYTVWLPFKTAPLIDIGDSLPIAIALYARMENRLQSRPEISKQYHDFLHEYLELGHIESVTENATTFKPVYILHHAVIRDSSNTTKLRVVFNASCKTRNGT